MAHVQAFLAASDRRSGQVAVICCVHGAGASAAALVAEGAAVYRVDCAGNLHTSVIEVLLRGGAGGVLVLACPPRDCRNREGAHWLEERVYHEREAELQARVDRARVRIAHASAGERHRAVAALRRFAAEIASLGLPAAQRTIEVDAACERLRPQARAGGKRRGAAPRARSEVGNTKGPHRAK